VIYDYFTFFGCLHVDTKPNGLDILLEDACSELQALRNDLVQISGKT
jgi:hypothetical protein